MSSSTRSAISALLVCLAVLWAAPAPAAAAKAQAAKKDVAAAKAAFGKGKKDFEAGRFKEAIAQYERAYALSSMPAILFNIGQCHKKLGNWEQAVDYFQRFLGESPKPIPNEALARQLLDESRAKLAEVTRKPKPDEPKVAATAPPPEATRPSAATADHAAAPAPDPTARPLVTSAPAPAPEKGKPDVVPAEAVAAAAPVEEVREEEGGVATKWWFWTLVGAVVVGGGVTAGVLATQQPQPLAQTSLGEIHF